MYRRHTVIKSQDGETDQNPTFRKFLDVQQALKEFSDVQQAGAQSILRRSAGV